MSVLWRRHGVGSQWAERAEGNIERATAGWGLEPKTPRSQGALAKWAVLRGLGGRRVEDLNVHDMLIWTLGTRLWWRCRMGSMDGGREVLASVCLCLSDCSQ